MKVSKIIRWIAIIIAVICLGILCFTLFFNKPFKSGKDTSLTEQMEIAVDSKPTDEEISNLPEGVLKDFATLYSVNNEVSGWLSIPDAGIDTVVVQSPEGTLPNNDKYLHGTNWQGNYYYYGAVFADARIKTTKDSGPANTIIYGHNMYPIDNDLFFSRLVNYETLSFYKQCPTIEYSSLYEKAKYKIFAIMYCNTSEKDGEVFNYIAGNYVTLNTEEIFNDYYNKIMERNLITNDVDVTYGDKILTLSTCENRFLKESRLVIFARKVRDGEDASVDVSKANINQNVRMPEAWSAKGYGALMK